MSEDDVSPMVRGRTPQLCDRCVNPTPATRVVTCYQGHRHHQCGGCAEWTAREAGLPDGVNEYGVPLSFFVCETCGRNFTVCPAVPPERRDDWRNCMADECPSYDINRDPTSLFLPDDPLLWEEQR